jgi:hypothetical protein
MEIFAACIVAIRANVLHESLSEAWCSLKAKIGISVAIA